MQIYTYTHFNNSKFTTTEQEHAKSVWSIFRDLSGTYIQTIMMFSNYHWVTYLFLLSNESEI